MNLDALELETARDPRATVLWLHGLGADGHDFEPIVAELDLPAAPAVRFVFPHAPLMPVTVNGGAVMRAWYDIYDLDGVRRPDEVGIRASQKRLELLIARENERGIATRAIVLAGFSQGGAIALQTGLRHRERLAGILALSTYLPLPHALADERSDANRDVPIFLAHGVDDPLIPLAGAERSRNRLTELGYRVAWHVYRMPHAVCGPEVADIAAWLRGVLADVPPRP